MFTFLLIFYSLVNCTKQYNIETFFEKEECSNTRITQVMKIYLKSRQCLTFIALTSDLYIPNKYFSFIKTPRIILKQSEDMYSITNMTYRPRRDFYLENGLVEMFCEERQEGFVMFSPNLQILKSYAFSKIINVFWNPRAYIFVYLSEPASETELSAFTSRIWHVFRAPHITVTCCTCAHVYTSSPMSRVGAVTKHELQNVLSNATLIDQKLEQLHGYPFRVCLFPSMMAKPVYKQDLIVDYQGVDGLLVDLLAERMDFTKIIITPENGQSYGYRRKDGTFSGALGLLLTGKVDFISVGFFMMEYRTRDAEPTESVQVDDLCVVVHRANIVPPWLAPVRYIGCDMCIVLAGVYFGVTMVWIAIQRFEIPRRPLDASATFLNTFRLMLTTSVPRLSSTTSERVFLACCTAAFVTLAGTFQGSLVTVYSTQFFYKDINTLEELAQTQMPILTRFKSFKDDIFTDAYNPTKAKLKDMIRIYNESKPINLRIVENGNIGGLTRRSSLDLDNQTMFYDKRGNKILHVVKECIKTYNIAYMLPRSSVFSSRINQIILRANQAGLFTKWYFDMAMNNTKYRRSSKENILNNRQQQNKNVPLSLSDLQLAMYGFAIGISASFLMFAFEIMNITLFFQCRYYFWFSNYCRLKK